MAIAPHPLRNRAPERRIERSDMELKVGYVCERGLNPKRPVNQDRLLALPDRGLFAVFDGVGGQRAGEIASQTAAETIEEAFKHAAAASNVEAIRRAVQFANRDIFEMATEDPAYQGMATTVALVHIDGDRATIAHVGDSRVYRLEGGRLHRETIDHTDLNDALRSGSITVADAAAANDGNVINRALGVEPDVDVEIRSLKIRDGARLLLCSDGIYRHLSDDEIAGVINSAGDPQRAADELKRIVFERGAEDNLTAVVVQLGRMRRADTARANTQAWGSQGKRAAGRASRIHVEVGTDEGRPVPAGSVNDEIEPPAVEGKSRRIIYALVTLLLMAAAFYAGLRAPEWLKNRAAGAQAVAADPMQAGREAFESGAFQAAVIEFGSLVKRDPQNADARYWLGRAHLEQDEFAKAAESFEQAVKLQPGLLDAYVQAAAAYEADGKREDAARMLRRYGEVRRLKD